MSRSNPSRRLPLTSSAARRSSRQISAAIEPLEQRLVMSAIVVNTFADQIDATSSHTVSLRDAITRADQSHGASISFDPKVFATHRLISLTAANGGLELSETSGPITIVGPAAGVSVGGADASNILTVDQHVTASITGLSIVGGGGSSGDAGTGVTNNGNLRISNSLISDNNFGGINNAGTLVLQNSTVTDNQLYYGPSSGGGIENTGTATVTGCNISNNAANAGGFEHGEPPPGDGGGIENGGMLTLVDSTLSGNSAAGNGGALDNYGTATVSDTTITANINIYGTGSLNNDEGGTLTIANTIIAVDSVAGNFKSLGHNIISQVDGNSSGWVKSDLTGTDAHPLQVKLSALGNFSGPTQSIVPLAGSPALQAGSVSLIPKGVTTDQRGLPRMIGGKVDIGATEINKAGPFSGTPAPFTLIQAENFDYGGQGVGYFNPLNTNTGGLYRPTEGVGIGAIPIADGGGYFVGWTHAGETLNYTVSVAATGTYTLSFRVASAPAGGKFHLNVGGVNVTGSLSIPATGDWNTYTVVSKAGVKLTAGTHVLTLVIDANGTSGAAGNFDWIKAVKT